MKTKRYSWSEFIQQVVIDSMTREPTGEGCFADAEIVKLHPKQKSKLTSLLKGKKNGRTSS